MFTKEDQLAVNTIRALSVDQIEAANSGHPGLPLGAAPMAYALWAGHLQVDPEVTDWINRDRFVLSAGHGSAMLYALLHAAGFDLTIEDLKNFRQLGSRTPGHPEVLDTPGIEATTGPLGQGVGQAVGMAMAQAHLAGKYNTDDYKIIDNYIYTLCSDGDLMEGISYESMSLAGKLKLDKLIMLYDSNDICLDGDLNATFVEDIEQRFESMGWHYQRVEDGNDLNAISDAIQAAKNNKNQPSMIEIKTVIGYGSPEEGTHNVHGAPLGEEDWDRTKAFYGWDEPAFTVPEEAAKLFKDKVFDRGQKARQDWEAKFEAYAKAYPELAEELQAAFSGELPEDYAADLVYQEADAPAEASRGSSGQAINALASRVPFLWGGSADLSGSNKTMIDGGGDFMPDHPEGRNIWFGVREFAMGAIMNGITLYGGSRVFGGTFFVFTDYLKAAVRVAALSKLPVTYVATHDSIAVGEDGPTHEPIEQLAAFRALPNVNVIRPADVNETNAAWKVAMESQDRPTLLVLTRQDLPVLPASKEAADRGVDRGAYIVSDSQGQTPDGLLIATGSEVALAIQAQELLREDEIDVRVVSMPSMNRFDEQPADYQEEILPREVNNRMSIEMGASFGWGRYIGLDGLAYGIDTFGASGPAADVLAEYGFTPEKVADAYRQHFN